MKHLYKVLLVLPLIGFGQGWEKYFDLNGLEYGIEVEQTNDGGYITLGIVPTTTSSDGDDLYLIKTNENGDEEWSKRFGGGEMSGGDVLQTSDGGYLLLGTKYTYQEFNGSFTNYSYDIYLVKTNSIGESEWIKTFGSDNSSEWGRSIEKTNDGGYIITGSGELELFKINEFGDLIWSQNYEYPLGPFQTGFYIKYGQQTIDGGFLICGNTSNGTFILKTDESGEQEWSEVFIENSLEETYCSSCKQTSDGFYILLRQGYSDQFILEPYNVSILTKISNKNNIEWSTTFMNMTGQNVQQTSDDGYIITGRSPFLLKTNNLGEEMWSINTDNWGKSVKQTYDGGYIITGDTYCCSLFNPDIYLIKTNQWGNITSTIELPTPTLKRELVKTTNILGQENTTIKNQPLIEIYDDGSVDKKYIIE